MKEVDDILAHFGVKGMKWGVRKLSGGVGIGRREKPAPSEDRIKADQAKAKIGRRGNTDPLTNKELQTLITRMNLEQQLVRLNESQKKTGPGAFVKNIIASTAKDEFDKFTRGKETKIIGTALALGAKGKHKKSKRRKR